MGTRDDYVAAIKAAFVSLGVRVAFAGLVARAPFLAFPVFKQITERILTLCFESFATNAETGAFFLYIDFRTGAQRTEFEDAAYANRVAQMNGTKEEKARAEQILWEKFVAFAKLSG